MTPEEFKAMQKATRKAKRIATEKAGELHDLVGHHLTALTLNLEVATHLVEGKALDHVQQAHSLAKLLLADVREAVSEMRLDDRVDVSAALQTLVDGMPEHVQEALSASIPFPSRLGKPKEFAELVMHIVENGYLNGETIRLDGAVRLAPK